MKTRNIERSWKNSAEEIKATSAGSISRNETVYWSYRYVRFQCGARLSVSIVDHVSRRFVVWPRPMSIITKMNKIGSVSTQAEDRCLRSIPIIRNHNDSESVIRIVHGQPDQVIQEALIWEIVFYTQFLNKVSLHGCSDRWILKWCTDYVLLLKFNRWYSHLIRRFKSLYFIGLRTFQCWNCCRFSNSIWYSLPWKPRSQAGTPFILSVGRASPSPTTSERGNGSECSLHDETA